jgi:hypothetical protein
MAHPSVYCMLEQTNDVVNDKELKTDSLISAVLLLIPT